MRVCDICHGGSNISSMVIAENKTEAIAANDNTLDTCSDCRQLLKNKDWIGLASKSGAGLVEDHVKKGTAYVTDKIIPWIMDYTRNVKVGDQPKQEDSGFGETQVKSTWQADPKVQKDPFGFGDVR